MPEEKFLSDFEDLCFPFQEYLDEPESPEDFPPHETGRQDISKMVAGTFEDRIAILREAIDEIDHSSFFGIFKKNSLLTLLRIFDNKQG